MKSYRVICGRRVTEIPHAIGLSVVLLLSVTHYNGVIRLRASAVTGISGSLKDYVPRQAICKVDCSMVCLESLAFVGISDATKSH